MDAIGDAPQMTYVPMGYKGYFCLDFATDFFVSRGPMFDPFSIDPEPSTYGVVACAVLATFVGSAVGGLHECSSRLSESRVAPALLRRRCTLARQCRRGLARR